MRPSEYWSECCGCTLGEAVNQASTGLPVMLMRDCWRYWKDRTQAPLTEKLSEKGKEAEMRGSRPEKVAMALPFSTCSDRTSLCVSGSKYFCSVGPRAVKVAKRRP